MTGELEQAATLVSGGGWAGIFTAIIVGGPLIYKSLRGVKADAADDRKVARQDDFVEGLLSRMKVLEERADTFAAERNRAIAAEAKLTAEVEALKVRVADYKAGRAEAREGLAKLEATIATMTLELETARKRIKELEDALPRRPEQAVPVNWEE